MRAVPWARALGALRFEPERWGQALRVAAPGGTHLIIRRYGAAELACWLPKGLAPRRGERFGLYLHPDRGLAERLRAAGRFRRAIGYGVPLARAPWPDAHRHAAMLCVHDLSAAGMALRDIAAHLLLPMPDDWRTSSERSDLRRLVDTASALVAGRYRALLDPSYRAP